MRKVVIGLLVGAVSLAQSGCFEIAVEESADARGCAWCGAAYGPLWAWLGLDCGWEEYEEDWVEDWYWSEGEGSYYDAYYDEWYFDAYYDQWYYSGYYDRWYCEQCDAWHYNDWYNESYCDEDDD